MNDDPSLASMIIGSVFLLVVLAAVVWLVMFTLNAVRVTIIQVTQMVLDARSRR